MENGVDPNEHLQSQAFRLGATDAVGRMYPFDFIGKMESLDLEWPRVVQRICKNAVGGGGGDLPAICLEVPSIASINISAVTVQLEHTNAREHGGVARIDDPLLVNRICSLYAQDYTCFGYQMPPECEPRH